MRVCVVDGRGGGLGGRLIERLRPHVTWDHELIALATNQAAGSAMREAGARHVGVGERAIRQTVPTVDVILASLNVVVPGSMLGEITMEIAEAILQAPGRKLLLPLNRAKLEVIGSEARTLEHLIGQTVQRVQALLRQSALP
jgi:hypothetical protein